MKIWVSDRVAGKRKVVVDNPPLIRGNPSAPVILKEFWGFIEACFGKKYMPKKPITKYALGAGVFGVVYETRTPGVVLKVTSDATEGKLIDEVLPILKKSPGAEWGLSGMVEYYGIIKLDTEFRDSRDVYVILREQVHSPGLMKSAEYLVDTSPDEEYDDIVGNRYILESELGRIKDYGDEIDTLRSDMSPSTFKKSFTAGLKHEMPHDTYIEHIGRLRELPYDDDARVVELVSLYGRASEVMRDGWFVRVLEADDVIEGEYWMGELIGRTLSYLFAHGVIIADLHDNNVGMVARADMPVIMDPGSAITK